MERTFDFAELCRSDEPMRSFRDPRHSVMLDARLAHADRQIAARVRNIARGGIMAECAFRGAAGDRVTVSLRGLGEIAGSVAWVAEDRIGVRFDAPVDPGTAMHRVSAPCPQIIRAPRQRSWRPALHRG